MKIKLLIYLSDIIETKLKIKHEPPLKNKYTMFGKEVSVAWVDHAYIRLDYIKNKTGGYIIINKPSSLKKIWQTTNWAHIVLNNYPFKKVNEKWKR